MKYRVYLDTFSGSVSNLKRGHRSHEDVLAALERDPMVSTWDMSEHAWLRNTIGDLKRDGLIAEHAQPYPWFRYALTDKGRALLRPNA